MRLATLLFSLATIFNFAWGKIFEKCELASDLVTKYNVSSEEVKSLVCIAEYESTFNSAAINHFNWDGSKDFGLFQLNNNFWCGNEFGQNVCKTSCESFLDDDLTDDLRCVQIIVKDTKRWMNVKNGYVAWVAYVNRCQNRNLDEYMSECTTALTTTTVSTSKAPVDTTVKPNLTTATTLTSIVPPKAQSPIRTSQQKPDQVRGPQIPIFKPIPVRENKPQTETQTPVITSQQSPSHVRGPQIPIFKPIPVRENKPQTETQTPVITSQQSPSHVRGPQIPIFKPIPVSESKPQADIQTPLKSEDASEPSKAPLMNIEVPQFINPLSIKVVQELLHILTGAISQLPSIELVHPEIGSLTGSDGESNFGNISPELHVQEGVIKKPNLNNILNDVIFVGLRNTNSNNPNLNDFPELNPLKGLTSFYTKKPAGIPIANHNHKYPLEFSPILEQMRTPYLALNRQKYSSIPLINSSGRFPIIFITSYDIYNPYQRFPHNRNIFFKQTPTRDSFMYPDPSYASLTPPYLLTHNRF